MKDIVKVTLLLLSFVVLSQASYKTPPKPIKCTKSNEIYKSAGTRCQPTCDDRNPTCTKDLVSGCFCKNGYIRNSRGDCILISKCPKPSCNGPNEQYVSCKNPCPDTCVSITSLEPQPVCSLPFPCPGGCDCLPGYVRDQNGVCILPEDCRVECRGANQTLNTCPGYCTFVEDCDSYLSGLIRDCPPPPEPFPCRPRCECTEGNILVFGECKNPNECCLDPNASVVDCPSECPRTCENLLETNIVCNKRCRVRGCQCNEGYVLDSRSKCIKPEECPPLPCPTNEHYNSCPAYCTFDPDCPSYVDGIIRDCAAPPEGGIPCSPRCECDEGFLRINGICQLPDACCGPNQEVVDCPNPCPETCDNYEIQNRPCNLSCKQRGCACKSGYVRDSNNNCIKKDECPKKNKCTKANEVYKVKGTRCQPTCENRNPKCTKDVVSGCFCIDGYIRNNKGECIPINECPKKCPANEEFLVCGPACQPTCENRTIKCKARCKPECHCKKGYIREVPGGKCIKVEHCPYDY